MNKIWYVPLAMLNTFVVAQAGAMYVEIGSQKEVEEEIVYYEDLPPEIQIMFNEELDFPLTASPRPIPRSPKIHERCLGMNLYFEARGESKRGQENVAHVTLNRVKDKRWADNVCGVVYEPSQFSWTLDEYRVRDWKTFDKMTDLAKDVLAGKVEDKSNGATFYYAQKHFDRNGPWWAKHYELVNVVSNHTFMR